MTETLWDEVAELPPGGHSRSILIPALAGAFYQHPSFAGGARKHPGDREGKLGCADTCPGSLYDPLHSWVHGVSSSIKRGKQLLLHFVEKREMYIDMSCLVYIGS